jgi:hypothetical protein
MSHPGVPGWAFSKAMTLDVIAEANDGAVVLVVLVVEVGTEVEFAPSRSAAARVGLWEHPASAPNAADAAVAAPACRRRRRDSSATSRPDGAQ